LNYEVFKLCHRLIKAIEMKSKIIVGGLAAALAVASPGVAQDYNQALGQYYSSTVNKVASWVRLLGKSPHQIGIERFYRRFNCIDGLEPSIMADALKIYKIKDGNTMITAAWADYSKNSFTPDNKVGDGDKLHIQAVKPNAKGWKYECVTHTIGGSSQINFLDYAVRFSGAIPAGRDI
jgi:hypothetical protein